MPSEIRRSFVASVGTFAALAVVAFLAIPPFPAVAGEGMTLTLQDTGKREYYCQATFELASPGEAMFQDVNGYFYVFVDDEQVGRSKGSSFRFDEGNSAASATFETPNAPCTDVNGFVFVVGACMQANSFVDRTECAAAIQPGDVVREVRAR